MAKQKQTAQPRDDEPMLILDVDANGKPTEKSIADMLAYFDFEETFGFLKQTNKKTESMDQNTLSKNKAD